MIAIRGAITVDLDVEEEIISKTERLITEILNKNAVKTEDIISVIVSQTVDITACYAVTAARNLNITSAGLFSTTEPDVTGDLPMCVRVLMLVNSEKAQSEAKHIYLDGAENLRPDLKGE